MAETLSIIPEGPLVRINRTPLPEAKPTASPELLCEERSEYASLCEELGIIDCSDLIREKLLAVLREENIHRFDNAQVVKYLDQELNGEWEWRGLRPQDVAHMVGWYTTVVRDVAFAKEPYRGAVPLPVLLTVKKIAKAVPEVFFFISAPKGDDGDPFLMVTSRNLSMFIVERWDEPNFRER